MSQDDFKINAAKFADLANKIKLAQRNRDTAVRELENLIAQRSGIETVLRRCVGPNIPRKLVILEGYVVEITLSGVSLVDEVTR